MQNVLQTNEYTSRIVRVILMPGPKRQFLDVEVNIRLRRQGQANLRDTLMAKIKQTLRAVPQHNNGATGQTERRHCHMLKRGN